MCAVMEDIIMGNMDIILIIVVDKSSQGLGSHVPKEPAKSQKLKSSISKSSVLDSWIDYNRLFFTKPRNEGGA